MTMQFSSRLRAALADRDDSEALLAELDMFEAVVTKNASAEEIMKRVGEAIDKWRASYEARIKRQVESIDRLLERLHAQKEQLDAVAK